MYQSEVPLYGKLLEIVRAINREVLEKNPAGGIHHIAFATDDVSAQLGQAAGAGVKLIHEQPFEGAAGKLVAFLHPKSTFGVLTEFCMPKPE
jgi:methylmalonyl-CoA/ethylmalonyl-CoA epimerase